MLLTIRYSRAALLRGPQLCILLGLSAVMPAARFLCESLPRTRCGVASRAALLANMSFIKSRLDAS